MAVCLSGRAWRGGSHRCLVGRTRKLGFVDRSSHIHILIPSERKDVENISHVIIRMGSEFPMDPN